MVDSGHIVFIRDAALWAVPFDLETLAITGAQVPVIQGVETNSQFGQATFTISKQGRLIYLPGEDGGEIGEQYSLRWVGKNGAITESKLAASSFGHIELAPSQDLAAVTIYAGDGASDIWVYDVDRGTIGRRTFEGKASRSIWSANGSTLFYRHNEFGLRAVAANGTQQPVTLFETDSPLLWPQTVSPDGTKILFNTGQPYSTYKLSLPSDKSESSELNAELVALAPVTNLNLQAEISPDGNFIAYCSNESGSSQVYVRPWPDIDKGKWQATIDGGCSSTWDPLGSTLYFTFANQMHTISYSTSDPDDDGKPNVIEFGLPEQLSQIDVQNFVGSPSTWNPFDYSSEREEFLSIGRIGSFVEGEEDNLFSAQTSVIVVEDWLSELSSIAPANSN